MSNQAEMEIIIKCQCGHISYQTERSTYFSLRLDDYQGVTCPQCHQSRWAIIAHAKDSQAYQAMETALQILTGQILNLRTELLFIKSAVVKEEAHE